KSVGDKGVDVIIEMLANVNLNNDLKLLSRGGRVIEEFQQFAGILQAGMEKGWVKPVIGSEYPLEKAVQAHEDIIHGSGKTGKMILLL
ncbi:hypothetical protein A6R68_00220, partial [Neotoma lepida]